MNRSTEQVGFPFPRANLDSFEIAVSDEQKHLSIDPEQLKQVSQSVLRDEGVCAAELSIALVDDATIHRVNRQFLEHDYPTDVISFPLGDPAGSGFDSQAEAAVARSSIEGEIVISGETACRCAGEQGCRPTDELVLYLVHGLLHLCGYDDHSASDRREMREREKSHLKKIGIPSHYEE